VGTGFAEHVVLGDVDRREDHVDAARERVLDVAVGAAGGGDALGADLVVRERVDVGHLDVHVDRLGGRDRVGVRELGIEERQHLVGLGRRDQTEVAESLQSRDEGVSVELGSNGHRCSSFVATRSE
jgi:hypothetical protein